ncbi:MAG: hypothetical protein J6Z11_04320 [Candidatus Riflebacteria bacterium]|nr:hypothetical protein [Candidatus Riflebacteria bacterium]
MNLKKTFSGFSLCFFILLIVFLTNTRSKAMIRDITLEELVQKSDVVVIADVLAIKEVGTLPSGTTVIANLVEVDQPLMGGAAIGERLKIKTWGIEDNPVFKKGLRTLLFLRKVDNYYEVVSGIAGSWPIVDDGKIAGYGTGKSLSDIEKAIENKNKKDSNKENTPKPKVSSESIRISI